MSAPQRRRAETPKVPVRPTKAERKRQLMEQAKILFQTNGYRGTTTEQVAAAAGVSLAVLARHFENKAALLAEVLQEIRAATLVRWRAETADLTDPLVKLHAIAERYTDSTRTHAREFRILHRALVETEDEEILSLLRAFYLDCEEALTEIIRAGQQAGVFRRSLDPRIGAWELIHTAMGYTLTLPLGIPLYNEPDHLARALDCLLHSLLKTDV